VVAQLIEHTVGVRPRIGGSGHEENHDALVRGKIDVYVEYIGTALRRMLGVELPRGNAFELVCEKSGRRWPVVWMPPFGFNNTYALLLRHADAERLGIRRCSDLVRVAPSLVLGAIEPAIRGDPAFSFAPGGIVGLQETYGLAFRAVRPLPSEPGLSHRALAEGEVDVLMDFPVHPAVWAHDLVEVENDRRFFPDYRACAVVHRGFLERYPTVRTVIERLTGKLDNRAMARLNFEVEVSGRSVQEVAWDWIRRMRLIEDHTKEGGG